MGCPQSKTKNKDISNGGSNVTENGPSRQGDLVSPADEKNHQESVKNPHDYPTISENDLSRQGDVVGSSVERNQQDPSKYSHSDPVIAENGPSKNGDMESPAEEKKRRQPKKYPHNYNDDPMVRGRADVYIPNLDDFDLDNEINEKKALNTEENIDKDAKEVANGFTAIADKESGERSHHIAETPSSDKEKAGNTSTKDNGSGQSDTNGQSDEVKQAKSKVIDLENLVSVFIPGEEEDSGYRTTENEDISNGQPLDTSQVDIGNVVNEIEIRNQFTKLNEENVFEADEGHLKPDGSDLIVEKSVDTKFTKAASDTESKQQETSVETTDGYTYSESSSTDFGSHSVRHLDKGKLVYGLPEGVPKPAPPKVRKADLIQPGTFAIAEKLAEQTPDNAFGSMQKLSSYLTGEVKKDDIESEEENLDGKNLPQICPTVTRKRDIIKDVEMFRKIDENTKKTPEGVKMSVEKLAKHLCSLASTDLEKIRAFYVWICNNIGLPSYIFDQSKTNADFLRYDAVSTLRQGQGSYVNLMAALCREGNIPVVTIPGCSKGLRHEPEKQFKLGERNHSWNAVYINSEWRFIDCTWGSGFLDAHGRFKRQFDEFWFLTDPEVFVYDHFPTHEIWQLLQEPIDIDEFNSLPSLTEKSREYGFQLISHREPIIYFQDEVTITCGTKEIPLSNITADLRNSEGKEINQHRCIQKIDGKTFSVRVVPPDVGQYALILYGKAKDYRHAKFMKLMEYMLRCDKVYSNKVTFPDHLKAWGAEPNYAEHGFAKSIENLSVFKSDTNEMTITLEQTRNVSLIPELKAVTDLKTELKDYSMITARQNVKIVHVRFPTSGYYKLDIFAEREDEKYDFAASFLIECTVTETPAKLPKYNASSICKNVCDLLEPLSQEIPGNSTVVFRIKSNGLRSAMVGIPMEKDYGSRLKGIGELVKQGDEFLAQIKTPDKGQTIYLSGCAVPPNVFWSRLYEFVTV